VLRQSLVIRLDVVAERLAATMDHTELGIHCGDYADIIKMAVKQAWGFIFSNCRYLADRVGNSR
jgi:hypothetical protein